MPRFTAVLLVVVLGAASGQMLLCESSCEDRTPASASEPCHDRPAGEGALTQLSNAHSCNHSDVVFTLTSSTVTFERFASTIPVPAFASSLATAHSIEPFAHSPPSRTHVPPHPAVTHLRI